MACLPTRVAAIAQHWALDIGHPFQPGGQTAWVAPARTDTGDDVVIKVAWRHREAAHEAQGLGEWNGNGAVRLHASIEYDDTIGLLIERCIPGTTLSMRPEPEQDIIIAALLQRLWRTPTPGHPFRPLQTMCDQWADEFIHKTAAAPTILDPGLVREGITLFRTLPTTAPRNVQLCTDLHAENVLAAEQEPWLVIDPKPYVGDPTYDVLQHLLNCYDRLRTNPRELTARMANLLDLDPDRLLLWLFARCVQESADWPVLAPIAQLVAPT